jgi:hypothetical protein
MSTPSTLIFILALSACSSLNDVSSCRFVDQPPNQLRKGEDERQIEEELNRIGGEVLHPIRNVDPLDGEAALWFNHCAPGLY